MIVRFAELNVDVRDAVLSEESQEVLGRVVGSRGRGAAGDTDPDGNGAGVGFLDLLLVVVVRGRLATLGLLESDNVERCEEDLKPQLASSTKRRMPVHLLREHP